MSEILKTDEETLRRFSATGSTLALAENRRGERLCGNCINASQRGH
jgi:hypothetical protein